ncbi:hypothetical protein Tco_0339719 [Tanacetum coccineum]
MLKSIHVDDHDTAHYIPIVRLIRNLNGTLSVAFIIRNVEIILRLEEFARILCIPCRGVCVFTFEWAISSLPNGIDSNPYIYPPSREDPLLIRDSFFYPRPPGDDSSLRKESLQDHAKWKRPRLPTLTPSESSESTSSSSRDANLICALGDYSRPSHEGYRNTIELPEGNNVDPSPCGRILLLVSLFNSFHQEGLQNSAMTSLCSNNIKESLFLKHGLVLRTYSKKSIIMASTFGSKSKYFMTMSIPPQDEPLTNRPVVSFMTETTKNPRDFAKPVKAISLPQDVPSTSDCRLIELENQVQCLM